VQVITFFVTRNTHNSELLLGRTVCNLTAAQLHITGALLMNLQWHSSVIQWKPCIWSVPSTATQHQNQQNKCKTMLSMHNKLMN